MKLFFLSYLLLIVLYLHKFCCHLNFCWYVYTKNACIPISSLAMLNWYWYNDLKYSKTRNKQSLQRFPAQSNWLSLWHAWLALSQTCLKCNKTPFSKGKSTTKRWAQLVTLAHTHTHAYTQHIRTPHTQLSWGKYEWTRNSGTKAKQVSLARPAPLCCPLV